MTNLEEISSQSPFFRDLSLIRKLTMKNPRMSEAMFAIANKYALTEEATLDTREQK
jgi:hypothetical protein